MGLLVYDLPVLAYELPVKEQVRLMAIKLLALKQQVHSA
jgi:hypothetical protein